MIKDISVSHTLWLLHAQKVKYGGCNITQRTLLRLVLDLLLLALDLAALLLRLLVLQQAELRRVARHDERHPVRRVRGVRLARLRVQHLLRVPVVCGDEQDVACLFARLVHSSDRFVRCGDGLDRCVELSGVADL